MFLKFQYRGRMNTEAKCIDCAAILPSKRQKRCHKCRKSQRRMYSRRYAQEHQGSISINGQNTRAAILGVQGTLSLPEWRELCFKYGDRCLCCGVKGRLVPDHIQSLSRGGLNVIENIQPLCGRCNNHKRSRTIDYRFEPDEVRQERWEQAEGMRRLLERMRQSPL